MTAKILETICSAIAWAAFPTMIIALVADGLHYLAHGCFNPELDKALQATLVLLYIGCAINFVKQEIEKNDK